MGVSKVGDRVKLLVAVKDLKQRCVREREQRIPATTTTTTTSSSSTAQAQQQHTSVSPSAQHHHLNHLNQPSLSPSLLNQHPHPRASSHHSPRSRPAPAHRDPRHAPEGPTAAPKSLPGSAQTPPSSEYLSASSDRGRARRNRLATDPGLPAPWTGDFGLPRAPAPGNLASALTRKTSMATHSSSSSSSTGNATPPAVNVSQTSLFLKKAAADHRRAPSLNSASLGPPGSAGPSPAGSKPISIVPSPSNLPTSAANNSGPAASSSPTSTGSPSRGLHTAALPGGSSSASAGLTSIQEDGGVGSGGVLGLREIGFKVGRGGFGRPTTPAGTVGVVAGTTSQIGPVCQPTLDEVIRKTIKVSLAENGTMKTINVENLKSANDLLDRVLRKFGHTGPAANRPGNLDEWALSPMPLNAVPGELNWGTIKQLDEHELLELCRTTNRPERQRGLLLHSVASGKRANRKMAAAPFFAGDELVITGVSPTLSPTLAGSSPTQSAHQQQQQQTKEAGGEPLAGVEEGGGGPGGEQAKTDPPPPRKTRNRASVVSVMSGLMIDPTRHSEPLPPDYQASLHQHAVHPEASSSGVGTGDRVTSLLASGRGKLRNFFGHRPPSEIISNHLVDFFPAVENKKHLSKSVRQSVRKSLAIRRSSQFSTLGRGSWDLAGYPPVPGGPAQMGRLSTDSGRSEQGRLSGADFTHTVHLEEPSEGGRRMSTEDTLGSLPDPAMAGRLGVKKGPRESDAASMLTLDEVTAEVENRRLSMVGAKLGGPEWGALSGLLAPAKKPAPDDDPRAPAEDEHGPARRSISSTRVERKVVRTAKASIKWVRGALIGQGSFGSVYLGMHALNGTLMAVKQVERPSGTSHNEERKKSMLGALVREIEFLKELQHTNIVQYLDSSADDSFFNIFLEYVPGGSVSTLLKNYGSFEEALVMTFTRQILQGLVYLHSKEIIHRDIKGANILVDNKGVIKISDFGISKRVEDNLLSTARIHRPSLQGSVFWMAPEVVKQTSYTRKADIWSLGCLMVEMLTGEHPWASLTQMQAIFRIGSFATPEIPDDISDHCIDLLKQTFLIDHHARPTALELSNHAFFSPGAPATTPAPAAPAEAPASAPAAAPEAPEAAPEEKQPDARTELPQDPAPNEPDTPSESDSLIENEARRVVVEASRELLSLRAADPDAA
ncbi:hypothetical protein PtB15_10B223 [Puccinia triticina]|nr:hypothetical protein PtB15_10B223 [Puccinia triticina]